ncbi:MAG: DUF1573 domain-containing protein [Saprospiraceae bacterium]|nr:DUF1573 domain-containing protein [Saprospiraceae bacterium]
MKKYILSAMLMMGFLSFSIAQNTVAPNETSEEMKVVDGPQMKFETFIVDYGTIEQNSEPLRTIEFTNAGNEPLVIKNARGSCGCTVPTFPKEPIMPGEKSKIEIRYATNRLGKFSKKVTLTTNAPGAPVVLTVKGNVLKEKEGVPSAEPNILKSGGNG